MLYECPGPLETEMPPRHDLLALYTSIDISNCHMVLLLLSSPAILAVGTSFAGLMTTARSSI